MKFPIKTTVALLVVGGIGAGVAYLPGYMKGLNKPNYRQAEVTKGPIVSMVNSTGTVQPVLSVTVGCFVSGPIVELLVDFNDLVKKNDLLARIDPRIYDAAVARDEALLATRKAELKSTEALLQQAINDENRSIALRKQNEDFISNAEMDKFKFSRMSLAAQKTVAEANVKQAEANLKNSKANQEYTEIRSPVDGIIINRKIDKGQTLAASFQTPELFIVAPDLKTMHIIASVDESDIGRIHAAKLRKLPVHFTVDSYPEDLFEGEIVQIRMNSTTTQNVVTYPVVVETKNPEIILTPEMVAKSKNPEFKLKPGMTASLSFQVEESKETLRIPNAALRFYPAREKVRPEDRKILEGTLQETKPDDEDQKPKLTAQEKAKGRKEHHRRHVWVVEGDFLRAVEVVTGISDNKYTQLISGELKEGQQLVTGIKTVGE